LDLLLFGVVAAEQMQEDVPYPPYFSLTGGHVAVGALDSEVSLPYTCVGGRHGYQYRLKRRPSMSLEMTLQGRPKRMLVILALVTTIGCGHREREEGPRYSTTDRNADTRVYTLAVYPLHNPARLIEIYHPLISYANRQQQAFRVQLEASRDYKSFEQKIRSRSPELILPNAWQTLEAMSHGYHVIALAGDQEDCRGIFIVRNESTIRSIADLRGKSVSYPSPTAFGACLLPQYFLFRHGIDINRDIENRYVGSQESSIMNVYQRKTSVGATWLRPWKAFQEDHPREAGELHVVWETEALVNNSVMVRDDVPALLRDTLLSLLVRLNATEEGRAVLEKLEISRFTRATDRDYDAVRSFIARFEHDVRKVEAE
jgi:phosphonate transport system substrate-binding protein